ncbi:MAG TPA: hypothetical protein VMH34_04005 [Gammaproteobacteria bacterium]|nr:hypothetical protein [Gammaproteobacteria bacterium]
MEYVIVLVFGVLVLTTGPGGNVMEQLADTIRSNFKGYSYAISLSDYPDADTPAEVAALYLQYGYDPSQVAQWIDDSGALGYFTQFIRNFPTLENFPDISLSDFL